MPEVIVMGAGAAGLSAALELADRGYKVKLIEKATLGLGSSGRNPGRMGHGFHYVDVDTAKMYLRASIEVQRKYPGYLIGQELPFTDPVRHGRYFIMKDSDNTAEEILATYEQIKQEYIRLIKEDPKNEVFGPPESFLRVLDPSEYEDKVSPGIVAVGVETSEHLFNWKKFIHAIRKKILSHPNIQLIENTEVITIKRGNLGTPRFSIYVKPTVTPDASETILHTDYIVNSTWQNIEKLNEQIGLTMVPGARTNRLKSLLVVKLPESLRNANSMFFCMGQHCMFSNLGNGYGMMTFANVTNMEACSGLALSDRAEKLLNGQISKEECDEIAATMLSGVTKYIPEMADATIVEVKFGIVQTAGKLSLSDLRDPTSTFHKRDYDGIREEQVGLVSNPCMKLFYFARNGKTVADLIDAEVIATKIIAKDMKTIERRAKKAQLPLHAEVRKTVLGNMERYTSSTQIQDQYRFLPDFFMNIVLFSKKNIGALILLSISVGAIAIGCATGCVPLILGGGVGAAMSLRFFQKPAQQKTVSDTIFETMKNKSAVMAELMQSPVTLKKTSK